VRILLDECVHIGVKAAFGGHIVESVTETGWRSSKDGPLLAFAQEQFDVFVTIDRNLEHQQNLARLKLGFVVVRVPSNELAYYLPLFEQLRIAAESVQKGAITYVVSHQTKR
jgi:predicted nuclease of predicted toxin-antitoxin system